MPISFNIEGPETKRLREAEMQERQLRTRMLQMAIEKEDPTTRGASLDAAMATMQDPNATTGQQAAAYARAGELGGTRQVEGLGAVPTIIPEDQVNDIMSRRTQMGAQRLANINQQIDQARQSGDTYGATALEEMRNIQFKSAKENFKKLPIKQAEELVEFKNLVQLGVKAVETTQEDLYGPIRGRIEAGKTIFGGSPDFTTMNQSYAGVRNQILKARSGAAVTPQEATRFLEEIGDVYQGDYKQRLELFTTQRRGEYLNKLQAYQEAGFDIPRSLQLGQVTDDVAGQPAGGASVGTVGSYKIDPASGKAVRTKR